jgi:hypothetical protein
MGFFDKIAKSIFGKEELEVERPAQSRSYPSTARLITPTPDAAVSATTNGKQRDSGPLESSSLSAVAVAELPPPPSVNAAPDTEVALTDELSRADFFGADFDQDLDDVFASLERQEVAPGSEVIAGGSATNDQVEVEQLFADIAANYARPVKNFVFELKRGTATKEWIEICRPAMHGITRAAEGMGLSQAAKRMVDFEAALSLAQTSEQRVLSGEIRDLLLWCYEDLTKVMPQAFVVGEEEQQREGIIINSLLMQIPNMGRVSLEKLYRAGLTSLDTLFLARRDDLAVATGIPSLLSERICQKFQIYKAELEGQARDVADSGQRARLAEMLTYLRQQHEGFQQASENEWADPNLAEEKKAFRYQRQACVLQINVILAEMGELDLVTELQKLSFDRRIRRLEEFLGSPVAAV